MRDDGGTGAQFQRVVMTVGGEKLPVSRAELRTVWADCGALVRQLDGLMRTCTMGVEEYLRMPAKMREVCDLLGFNRTVYEMEMMAAFFGG